LVRAFISSIKSLSTPSSELNEMVSSTMSRLGVGIGLGPQNEDSINIVCGELDRRPEELLLIEDILEMRGGAVVGLPVVPFAEVPSLPGSILPVSIP